MEKFKFIETDIEGLKVIESTMFGDERGYFMETFQRNEFALAGLPVDYAQDNQSKSKRGVLRGLHFQKKYPQGKLVRVVLGEVYDVGVDLRQGSSTYGKHYGLMLSAENKLQFYVPEGFAHGFLVLSETAVLIYKCTRFYDPADEGGIIWNDPGIGVDWPLDGISPILSDRDLQWPRLS